MCRKRVSRDLLTSARKSTLSCLGPCLELNGRSRSVWYSRLAWWKVGGPADELPHSRGMKSVRTQISTVMPRVCWKCGMTVVSMPGDGIVHKDTNMKPTENHRGGNSRGVRQREPVIN